MKRLIEAGDYRAVIDRVYPMEDVAEAHRYVESWQKAGNVVLRVAESAPGEAVATAIQGKEVSAKRP